MPPDDSGRGSGGTYIACEHAFVSEHALRIDVSHGQNSALYTAFCACSWISGDGRTEAQVRREWRDHVSGKVPAWIMQSDQTPGWEGRSDRA